MKTKRILCPVDFSGCSRVALEAAIGLARNKGCQLTLVHVHDAVTEVLSPLSAEVLPRRVEDAVRDLSSWSSDAQLKGASEVIDKVIEGTPRKEIVALAERLKVDLIVMGTHGRTGIRRALVGSVAEHVVGHAPCSVLVVR